MLIRKMEPNTVKATAQEKIDTASAEEKDNASAFFDPEHQSPQDHRTSAKRPHKASDKNTSFVEKLWEVLNAPEYREAIHWSKDGQSFRIEPKMFYETSLNTKEFQSCKFESFLRRLLRGKFERVILEEEFPINAFVYQHASFRADKPDLIAQLNPPRGAKTEAKKSRKKQKKAVSADAAPSSAPLSTSPNTRIEESKAASPSHAHGATQQGIISHLMAAREDAAAGSFSNVAGFDRSSLLHSLGGNVSDPIGLLLQKRNELANIVSSSLNSRIAADRTLLARQLLAQQEEDAMLVSLLQQRSQMQADDFLRSGSLFSNSTMDPRADLSSVSRFLAENRGQHNTSTSQSLFLPSVLQERRSSPPLSSAAILEAFRRGQLTIDEAEILLRHRSQSDADSMSRFLPPR